MKKPAAADPKFLAGLAVFGGLTEKEIVDIARRFEVRTLDGAGELFREGTAAREMFVVREGQLEVRKKNSRGIDVRVATLKAGDCVGEMGLIDIQPRSATVTAQGPATLLVLTSDSLSEIAHSAPPTWTMLVMNIAREISRRLRRADEMLVEMALPVDIEDLWRNWKPPQGPN